MKTLWLCLLLAPAIAVAAPPKDSAPPGGPMATLKSYNEKLDKLLRKKGDDTVDKTAVTKLANELFDYRELARRALAQHWDKLSKAQQDEFTKVFSEMLEKNYVKQLRGNVDYEVIYNNESITEGEATVASIVKVRTKGKSTDVSIDYKMKKSPGPGGDKWVVYDVITDEVSMVRNYRSQFNKIITTESYDALLAKMRKRIADADKPAK